MKWQLCCILDTTDASPWRTHLRDVRGDVSPTTLDPVNAPAPEPSLDINDASTWPVFMRIEEVAAVLRVNRSTIDKAIKERALPVVPGLSSRSTRVHKSVLLSSTWWDGQTEASGGDNHE